MFTGFDAGIGSESLSYRFDDDSSEKMSARRIRIMGGYGMSASEGLADMVSWPGNFRFGPRLCENESRHSGTALDQQGLTTMR
jgi:hypothetical protein